MDPKQRILIVDDEEINLEFFEVMLSNLGFYVFLASNGLEALESVRKVKPDLIILDNVMPKLTGWEVTKILKNDPEYADYADIPIIMFSALDDVKDKVEGLELGADDYITKPFNFAEVLARIRVVLRTHELIRQIENREKRIRLGETIFKEIELATSQTHKHLDIIGNSAKDPAAIAKNASEALAILDSLAEKTGNLKNEYVKLSAEALDIAALRRKARTAVHQ